MAAWNSENTIEAKPKKTRQEEVNIANLPLPLEIKHQKGIEDKVNKYKGLFGVPFLLQRGLNGRKNAT